MLKIHPTARISPHADIEDSVRGSTIEIGEDSMVDSFVKVKPAGGTGDLRIGRRTYINSGSVLYTGNGLVIGDDVLVAANCTFAPVDHEFRSRELRIVEQRFRPSKGGIVVEDDVWIGAGCIVLDGARIHRGCVVGAGSIVVGELEPYAVYRGRPLQKVGLRE